MTPCRLRAAAVDLAALGRPAGGMLAERAVERAVAAGARVTALPAGQATALQAAGDVVAQLRS